MTNHAIAAVLLAALAGCQQGKPPVFIDLDRAFAESAAGKGAVQEFQAASAARHQRAEAAAQAAQKAADGPDRQAKFAQAQRLAQEAQERDAAQRKDIAADFRGRVGLIVDRLYPDRPHVALPPIGAGQDVTVEVIAQLDSANVDAVKQLQAAKDENARLRERLSKAKSP